MLKEGLLLNGCSCVAPGLAQGKAGIALSLFAFARMTGDEQLEERAFCLMQQALVYGGKNINFQVGNPGVGFVLIHLIREHFIEADFDELFGEQHRLIVQTISSDRFEVKNIQECAELLLYLHATGDFQAGKDLQLAEEILIYELLEYYGELPVKQMSNYHPEQFYRCSALLMTIFGKEALGEKWWEEIRKCCCARQKQSLVCESMELGYKLMEYGKFAENEEAEVLGRQLFAQAVSNKFPEIMSLREQTNLLYFFSQIDDDSCIPETDHLVRKLAENLIYAELEKLEKQVVGAVWHYAFYCGLESGMARLLLLRTYWQQLEKKERLPFLEYFFF